MLATAAVTPLYARLFDRFGQRKVGPVILTVQIIVMLGFAFAALMRVPIPLLFVLAVVMGMTQFSFGALVRTRWAYVLDRADKEDLLNTAYALESAIDEIVFIFGPILAAFLAASVHPVSQLFVPTLACAFGGAVFFALRDTQPPVLREITVVAADTDDADVRLAAGGAAGAAVSADRFDLDRLKTGDRDRNKRNVLTYAGVLPLLAVFIVFNMAFTAFDTSMTAVMKSLHLDSVLGVQLAMLAVGSCIGALVFGSRELKGSRWRHMIMFLALMTVGYVVIRLCQGNLIVMGLVEILTGLTVSPVFAYRQPHRQGDRARGIAHRRPVLGDHRRHGRHVVRLDDRRHRARRIQPAHEHDDSVDRHPVRGAARPARLVPRPKTAGSGNWSCNEYSRLTRRPTDRSGLEQPGRVRVRWMVEHVIHVAGFQQTPGIHDRHLVGDLRDHAEIMGDEQHEIRIRPSATSAGRGSAPVSSRRAGGRSVGMFSSARSHCRTPRTPPSSVGSVSLRRCRAETSVTTGNCRMVLPFTLPAICDSPLSQVTSCTYSQPFASNSGCTVAQPTSVFQNHSEVEGFARFDHWAT